MKPAGRPASRKPAVASPLGSPAAKAATATKSAPRRLADALLCAVFALAILLPLAMRVRLLAAPLERDEGEYAYMGRLLLEGIPPYGVAANMKFPGIYAAYALIMAAFGQTVAGIHLGFLLVNLGSIALVYFIARNLFERDAPALRLSRPGLAAAACYAVLTVSLGVLGLWAHATHFVVLPALAAIWLLLGWRRSRNPIALGASGALFGVAILMKQPGICFSLFAAALVAAWTGRGAGAGKRLRATLANLALLVASAAAPLIVTGLLLWRAGVFGRFWFWTVAYAREYGTLMSLAEGLTEFGWELPSVLADTWPIWILAAAGLAWLWSNRSRRDTALWLTALLALSFAGVSAGLYFRPHYWVLVLPAVALAAGALAAGDAPGGRRALAPWCVAAALAISLIGERALLSITPNEASRLAYRYMPFVEAVEVGQYLKAHQSNDTRLAIIGSEPEIAFYAARQLVTPYLYLFPLMESQPFAAAMREEFIRDVEAARAEYIVVVGNPTSLGMDADASRPLLEWFAAYRLRYYEQVGLIDMLPEGTRYHWGDVAHLPPKSPLWITILKRKPEL